ncbi:hypothetical protein RhiirA5_448560 [Rhizophagus irregularis]|uniref:DUF4238 domain-containing protein n=4 Tax=Rhizophagus irregularis TaxID=588596 RepID=U9SYZ0_RHIID|nr:hypothetical protein GLOIN_2v1574864 [Rhizophagus irregularis DAOM 181602=DAOM 197198]EXX55054.1 hypothetical protein RirG_228730 [Rhizophagus irregularis DAOM 197198w]PKC15167.1 hypothetical protein RhiirA5_448560 [Rhizophagus irregularis]POG74548.1 hypothetical protein GLOIN_2v1574864 [Rhizophagus irregularis DAOM 181602=DAOM 197198]UZO10399.1 hypothetical protein OCT59_001984 [Rhizophagus irregularis]CAB4481612.1 unnamed protein product [Rhizophagus irregularis]|eukprot:XP_025181414.1 hypothetical protein GLOIN_2v1574864 [Rhizophagus irregularis DAOM 181602=DAOM 197198]
MDQYHHYIPRFLLRNFAIDKYERIFESNIKQQKKKNRRKAELLQTYDRNKDQLGVYLISRTYGYQNMYKDLNNKDVMHVEERLAKLERRASETIHNIVKASRVENQVVLLRRDLGELRKFLFIMNYRNCQRWSQFTDEKFDSITLSMVKTFMQQHNLQKPKEVWLQNISEILDTPHEEVGNNQKIFSIDREDYKQRMIDCFLIIWQAGENDEFIITSNGFGIFEGVSGNMFGAFPFQYAFHSFYVISPKLVLVLCPTVFRKEVGADELYRFFGGQRSIFENVPHPGATPNYVSTGNSSRSKPKNEHSHSKFDATDPFDLRSRAFDMTLNSMGIERQWNDTFTFSFVKLDSATVHLVNYILLNETKPDLVLTFLSRPYLYKTIAKYHKKVGVQHDFSNLKKKLFIALNRTHKDDLHLRKNIPTGQTYSWNVRETNSES